MLRNSFGLACQADTQPIAYFLANSGTANAVDLDIIPNGWTDHEIFPVGLAAVKTPGVKGITAMEGRLFRRCSVVSRGAPARALYANESGAPHPQRRSWIRVQASTKGLIRPHRERLHSNRRKHVEVQPIAPGVNTKKAADFSAALCM
jgi:hypothetical protein